MVVENKYNSSEFSVVLSLDYGNITLQTESIEELYFIENIFSFSMSGKIRFNDKYGVYEFGPLTGNEKLTIIFGEEENKEYQFYIYKIANVQDDAKVQTGTTQTISMFFTDDLFYGLNFLQFSKSWKGEKISKIIKDISEDILGVQTWDKQETTKNKLDYFYSPYWTANTSLNWLLKRAKESNSKTSGMCLYNTPYGFNLVSLETLLSNTKKLKIGNEDDGIYVFEDTNEVYYNRILGWSVSGLDNTALKIIAGNTNLGFNSLTKSFLKSEKKYTDMIENHTVLGTKSLYNDKSDYRIGFNLTGEDSDNSMYNIYQTQWNKAYDNQQIIYITVRGHEARYCGNIIEIKWPSSNKITQVFNENLNGYFLIKSITHYFTGKKNPSYTQKLALIKNGYEDTDTIELVKATKKNKAR